MIVFLWECIEIVTRACTICGSQFVLSPSAWLLCVLGRLTDGMEIHKERHAQVF